jgi:hypothetical protein
MALENCEPDNVCRATVGQAAGDFLLATYTSLWLEALWGSNVAINGELVNAAQASYRGPDDKSVLRFST